MKERQSFKQFSVAFKKEKVTKAERLVVENESEGAKTLELLKRVAELERIVGQKQLQIDYLEKSIELGSEEVGFDIKKKYATGHSTISSQSKRS
ncbi:MAG: hypothetical protein B6I19_07460 [Bacteroidetes bacterium 4572_114]|nr:MAG: hypothetical protein B6I19_07460 [Bacteroidetes bacterium 4572_114]